MKVDQSFVDAVNSHISSLEGTGGGVDPIKKTPDVKDVIPKPDFTNAQEIQKYRNALHKKYPGLNEREDLPEYLDQTIKGSALKTKDMIRTIAQSKGIDPATLYTSAMEEGMRGLFPTKANKGSIDYFDADGKGFPISGFLNFGLDTFSDQFPDLVKKGYLIPDFKSRFQKTVETNEHKQKVNSASFKTADDAIEAKAAMLKLSNDYVGDFSKKNNIHLSDKAKEFFSLIHYNAGEGNMEKMLKSYKEKGFLKDDKFLEKQPDSSWTAPYQNVIKRINAAHALKQEGYF